jgi:3-deoxy-manno-octulosonate cytidylyltransferase (CMP-KDO synthetase)
MKILALIPARMGSSRFPGKPLALIMGKPMIEHVYERVSKSPLISTTVVATCDEEIKKYIESIGGNVVMTKDTHERASDRCAEALITVEKLNNTRYDIVVMVQGDEPLINSKMIEQALEPMIKDHGVNIVNLLGKIQNNEEFIDKNCIKVVCDKNFDALYFSREPIPYLLHGEVPTVGKQVCVIPFRRDFLFDYTALMPTPLECLESIDMLRILENGMKVRMVPTEFQNQSVDTPNDILRVEEMLGFPSVSE